jgi:hypothetical protein
LIPAISPWVSAAKGLASAAVSILSDPRNDLPDYSMQISDLQWILRVTSVRWGTSPDTEIQTEVDSWTTSTQNLLDLFKDKQALSHSLSAKYATMSPKLTYSGGTASLSYIDESGDPYYHTITDLSLSKRRPRNRSCSNETSKHNASGFDVDASITSIKRTSKR